MEDPKVIYLGPACQKEGDGREWCEDDVWTQCECGCSSVRYTLERDAQSELAALRVELSEVSGTLEFNTNCWGRERAVMIDKNQVLQQRLTAAESELAALREELEHSECMRENYKIDAKVYKDALTAAEQRNSVMTECLERLRGCSQLRPTPSLVELIDSALQPTESGASE